MVTKIKFIEKPSLAVLNKILSDRFNKPIKVSMADDGIELEGDLTVGDITRLELMFERWGYLLESET